MAIAFAPIFLANMVFSQRFRDTGDSTTAFGANLLGAVIGGILEYLSLIVGYRWLLALVALLYGAGVHHRAGPPAGRRAPLARVPGTVRRARSATTETVDPARRGPSMPVDGGRRSRQPNAASAASSPVRVA